MLKLSKKTTWKVWVSVFLCYIPYLIIFFPGACNWDTIGQISDFYGGNSPIPFGWMEGQTEITPFLSDHHPVFDTTIFSLFVKIGTEWFHNANIGFFLYVLLQAALFALTFTFAVHVMQELGVSQRIQKLSLVFWAVFPPIGLYAIGMIKDSLFAIVFLWYFLFYLLIVLKGANRKRLVGLIVFSVLMALTKKTGVYIALVTALILLPLLWKKFRSLGVLNVALAPIVIFIIMGKIVFPLLNIEPSGAQEMLALPIQQVSRVVVEKDIPKHDQEIIDQVIDFAKIRDLYDSSLVDGIKGTYRYGASRADIGNFLGLWVRYGWENPVLYLKASYGLVGGFFWPKDIVNVYTDIAEPWRNGPDIYQPTSLEGARDFATELYYGLARVPVITLIFRIAVYTFLIPISVVIFLIWRRRGMIVRALIPIGLIICTLAICPTTDARYGLPLIMATPLLIACCCLKIEKRQKIDYNGVRGKVHE